MPASLEDHERRIADLERKAEREESIKRAIAEIVAESEKRITAALDRLTDRVEAFEKQIDASERRMVDIMNERFNAVMDALDRPKTQEERG